MTVPADEFRATTAQRANEAAAGSKRPMPVLAADSSRETLLAWLSANDPNGSYSDEASIAEGFDPMALEDAWDLVARQLEEA